MMLWHLHGAPEAWYTERRLEVGLSASSSLLPQMRIQVYAPILYIGDRRVQIPPAVLPTTERHKMSNLVNRTGYAISKSPSGTAGKGLVVAGGTGLGLWAVAGLIPFVSLPMLLVAMVVLGVFMWE